MGAESNLHSVKLTHDAAKHELLHHSQGALEPHRQACRLLHLLEHLRLVLTLDPSGINSACSLLKKKQHNIDTRLLLLTGKL